MPQELAEIAAKYNLLLIRELGHSNIPGNCRKDYLAKDGTKLPPVEIYMKVVACLIMLSSYSVTPLDLW